ncbi:MAG: A/G-specific adenine glycosylase [Xanthomonadales bacterium]|nr:A/G-specific adenine glycosylase [Xanthomonadales bacterium]
MPSAFSDRLLAWWDKNGRKDLPWQNPRTPYRVWISEIMLQQTQVATVIPYFERWMKSFPDIESLAGTSQDKLLAHWAGLGYYARARNIHKTAVICLEQNGGELPASSAELTALPGIGLSTANAIISQSTDKPAAVLDGNVRRVLARHTATRGWTGAAAVQKKLWELAETRLPMNRGADYTQAIMDLGAMVCSRSKPDCANCPVRLDCEARLQGRIDQLPSPKPATRVSDVTLQMLILKDEKGRVLLEKRPGTGIWGGLWCLPAGDSLECIATALGAGLNGKKTLSPVEHRLSHLRMTIHPVLATPGNATQVQCSSERGWFDREQQTNLGLPKPVSDLLSRLDNGELK